MNILIIGSGGREHALAWKIRQSKRVKNIWIAPGNGGTGLVGTTIPLQSNDLVGLFTFAKKNAIDLTIVGPEAPLAMGIVDFFEKEGLAIFGPTKQAARLETSKAWAIKFMKRHHIPHPKSHIFDSFNQAQTFIKQSSWKTYVIKADGLASGKGVILTDSKKEAIQTAQDMLAGQAFGKAGKQILIQEKLTGYEISIVALADGTRAIPLPPAQDHKRIYAGDKGPNTGGMGAYAPVSFLSHSLLSTIKQTILRPLMAGMRKEGHPYKGVIYPGLMITPDGPKVLEFNCRFGDPETQPQMMLLKSDLIDAIEACIHGNLTAQHLLFKKGSAVCVVAASKGYPTSYEKGVLIQGLDTKINPDVQIFHAGTKRQGKEVITDSGRVLGITAYGSTIKIARKKAYDSLGKQTIHFNGMQYRADIAYQAL